MSKIVGDLTFKYKGIITVKIAHILGLHLTPVHRTGLPSVELESQCTAEQTSCRE